MSKKFDFGNGPVPAHRHNNPNGSLGGWVANTATVEKTVHVSKNARVFGNVRVSGNALVFGNARVSGNALVFGNAEISDLRISGTLPDFLFKYSWGKLSPRLTLEMMRLDASFHPNPKSFDKWAKGGPCPYSNMGIKRFANFEQNPKYWKPGKPTMTPIQLLRALFKYKKIKSKVPGINC